MKIKICICHTKDDPWDPDSRYIYEYVPGYYISLLKALKRCKKIDDAFKALDLPMRCKYERLS